MLLKYISPSLSLSLPLPLPLPLSLLFLPSLPPLPPSPSLSLSPFLPPSLLSLSPLPPLSSFLLSLVTYIVVSAPSLSLSCCLVYLTMVDTIMPESVCDVGIHISFINWQSCITRKLFFLKHNACSICVCVYYGHLQPTRCMAARKSGNKQRVNRYSTIKLD